MPESSIENKIRWAKTRFAAYGSEILADSRLPGLLSDYREAVGDTRLLMIESGVVELCGSCASEEHGSCCAKWVEDWYDEWLLFINLLMGVEIEFDSEDAKSCSFAGPNGCRLIARYSFCVNFLCPTIERSVGSKTTEKLLIVSGTELFAGWVMEQELRKWVTAKERRYEEKR